MRVIVCERETEERERVCVCLIVGESICVKERSCKCLREIE